MESAAPIKSIFARGNLRDIRGNFCIENGRVNDGVWEIRLDTIKLDVAAYAVKTWCVETSLINHYSRLHLGDLEYRRQPIALFSISGHHTFYQNPSHLWFEINTPTLKPQFFLRNIDTDEVEGTIDDSTVMFLLYRKKA
jgi:hypothetical protein